MNQYIAYFDFTSVKRNGGFIGRNGQLAFQSDNYINELMDGMEEIKELCAKYIYSQKPNCKVLTITVTHIKQLN